MLSLGLATSLCPFLFSCKLKLACVLSCKPAPSVSHLLLKCLLISNQWNALEKTREREAPDKQEWGLPPKGKDWSFVLIWPEGFPYLTLQIIGHWAHHWMLSLDFCKGTYKLCSFWNLPCLPGLYQVDHQASRVKFRKHLPICRYQLVIARKEKFH